MRTEILKELTPEKKEQIKLRRVKAIKKKTSEYQLGNYIGEYILSRYLPTLSTDMIKSNKVIPVSDEDESTHKRLNEEWFNTTRNGGSDENAEWIALQNHQKMMEEKYLPHVLKCYLNPLNIKNEKDIKKGIIDVLWDSDMCSYSLDQKDIKIYNDDEYYFTIIEFKLRLN